MRPPRRPRCALVPLQRCPLVPTTSLVGRACLGYIIRSCPLRSAKAVERNMLTVLRDAKPMLSPGSFTTEEFKQALNEHEENGITPGVWYLCDTPPELADLGSNSLCARFGLSQSELDSMWMSAGINPETARPATFKSKIGNGLVVEKMRSGPDHPVSMRNYSKHLRYVSGPQALCTSIRGDRSHCTHNNHL